MDLIACADKNWGIGYKGDLLFHIPDDLKRFRTLTLNKTVVMGRKTLQSLPGAKPLNDRVNIVLTRDKSFEKCGVLIFNSVEEFLLEYDALNTPGIFVIGGAEVYRELMPYCKRAYITRVDAQSPADAYICDFDKSENFVLSERSKAFDYNGLKYTYDVYENLKLAAL